MTASLVPAMAIATVLLALITSSPLIAQDVFESAKAKGLKFLIADARVTDIDSANGVSVAIKWAHIDPTRTVKYIRFTAVPYNRVGDIQSSSIGGKSSTILEVTGPFESAAEFHESEWETVWYNPTIDCVKIVSVRIDYMNGTSYTYAQELPKLYVDGFINDCSYAGRQRQKAALEEARLKQKQAEEEARQRRFVDNGDGTVTDTQTGLMWAAKDNGSDISWDNAQKYCETYGAGGHSDWRQPTIAELRALYDPSVSQPTDIPYVTVHLVTTIDLTGPWVWSSEEPNVARARQYFFFDQGGAFTSSPSSMRRLRALPVRGPITQEAR